MASADVLSDHVKTKNILQPIGTAIKRKLQPVGTVIKRVKVDFNIANKKVRKEADDGTTEIDKYRDNITALVVNTNATPIRCVQGGRYCCCFCQSQFPNAAELKRHNLEEHDVKLKKNYFGPGNGQRLCNLLVKLDITALKCNICDANLLNIEESLEHLKSHGIAIHVDIKSRILPFKFDSDVLRCAICAEVFTGFQVLISHMNVHFKNFICEICSAGFSLLKNLNTHRGIHKTGEFGCELCHKVFNTRQKRVQHNRNVHLKVRHHKCGYCNAKFNCNRARNKHMESEHGIKIKEVNKERRHICSECGMRFFAKRDLDKHFVKHTGLKEYLCEYCQKAFGRKNTLREHLRIHEEDKRFKCELCGQAFVQKCSWKSHMKSRHGETV